MERLIVAVSLCVFLSWLLFFIIDSVFKFLFFKYSYREGLRRYIRLNEYPIGRKMRILTDKHFKRYESVKGTSMENKKVPFEVDSQGFISQPDRNSNAQIKIVFMGDSATECAIVNPENRFPYIVQTILNRKDNKSVAVYNAGIGTGNLFEMCVDLLCKVVPLEPKIVVFSSNFRDILYLRNAKNKTEPEIQLLINDNGEGRGFKNRIYYERDTGASTIHRIKEICRIMYPNISLLYQLCHKKRDKKRKESGDGKESHSKDYLDTLFKNISCNYSSCFRMFISICRENGIIPVVMTQASNLGSKNKEIEEIFYRYTYYAKLTYSEFAGFHEGINNLIKTLAINENVLCIDLSEKVNDLKRGNERDFIYDHGHYTDKGSVMVGKIIAEELNKLLGDSLCLDD